MVATRLATGGDSWTSIFSKFNSGTYNNQVFVEVAIYSMLNIIFGLNEQN